MIKNSKNETKNENSEPQIREKRCNARQNFSKTNMKMQPRFSIYYKKTAMKYNKLKKQQTFMRPLGRFKNK
jgi:hypothetical protein